MSRRKLLLLIGFLIALVAVEVQAQDSRSLTPVQFEIQKQVARLGSADVEERRDAVTRLGSMHHPDASRAALPALGDGSAIVRATAAAAVLSLPSHDSAAGLIPLLNDKDEFVRREAAYALGRAGSSSAVATLIERLTTDKKPEVRGAAAVALGQIGNVGAIPSLTAILVPLTSTSKKKSKGEQDVFVLRAVARALGQIKSSDGMPALVKVLENGEAESDVRREAAWALGEIGDAAALSALTFARSSTDPHLSQAAHDAIQKIRGVP